MDEKNKIFLTRQEALRAIRLDFEQYGAQPRLFTELCRPILGGRALVQKGGNHAGVWVKHRHKNKMRRIRDDALGEYLLRALNENSYPVSVLAEICSKVFETKAYSGKQSKTGCDGIWIETGEESLNCRQCGSCCINLIYHKDCTEKDYNRWIAMGRFDILERVKLVQYGSKIIGYRIWFNPKTGRLFSKCPWLKKDDSKNHYSCTIHDVKPEICRQYPLTGKHAEMTGCGMLTDTS
ncbi:MAG: YkgJ family cysteine cluster protein [Desulfobacterales bacterium]|nr:YkgJ family cysteine cluster protein [Desulfobacterales bacterium]